MKKLDLGPATASLLGSSQDFA
uniref:Uncharacterized protein n=1 Tax=Anguilla anguilla TaxID=7936 RepID=A0A0E9RMW8_ANGAN